MTKKLRADHPKSIERRRFLQVAGGVGFTTAVVAGAGTLAVSSEAIAQTAKEEQMRQKAAKYTMTIATPYVIGASRIVPIMQLDFKENIQSMSMGEIYVKLAPGGQLGVGGQIAKKVQAGTIQAGLHSLANMAPFAPAVDLINIPYWCGENQKFVNLVASDVWRDEINPKVEARGFRPLWYVVTDPRVCALRKGLEGPIRTPDDLKGIKFRVPGSKILQQFYRLLGATPTPVPWGETPSAMKQGVADALDPTVQALFLYGFTDVLSWVTFNRPVSDALVYSCNLKWLKGLPEHLQDAIAFASDVTFQQDLAKVPAARAYTMAEMGKTGVQFYVPTADEYEQWKKKAGHQHPEWDSFKKELAGSLEVFDRLLKAANTKSEYTVHDV